MKPLPISISECRERGWDEVDIILVSGDAYIDHPAFGIALIGRLLERHGYRVAVLPQPRFDSTDDFQRLGRPRLFFGISGGNLDSTVANYSGNGKVRDFDAYSPAGSPWRSSRQAKDNRYRPDRASLIYANLARHAYPGVTVILGGVEASLRRFIHFDYKQNRLRGSLLSDTKADLLVYGMGEKAVLEAAGRLSQGKDLANIKGSCIKLNEREFVQLQKQSDKAGTRITILPSWKMIEADRKLFLSAEKEIDRHARERSQTLVAQKQQAAWIVEYPVSPPLNTAEMDQLYDLPFSRLPHPSTPDVPAFTMIKDSITIVRGCSGNCSFCAISRHQGPSASSRSISSILKEIESVAGQKDFNGTVTDLGGPTANLYGTSCAIGSCKKHDCLYPDICKNLIVDETRFISLLDQALQIKGVKHVYISSGLRMKLLVHAPQLMRKLIEAHIPGNLKIAPEHTEKDVLELMHKEPHKDLLAFLKKYRSLCRELGKKDTLTPYIISAHPGCTLEETIRMVSKLKNLGLTIRQFQDFTPTPGTLSTAMFVSGCHRDSGKPIPIPQSQTDRHKQRQVIEKAFFSSPPQKARKSRIKRNKKKQ